MPTYTRLYDRERGLEGEDKEYAFILPDKILKQGYNRIGFQSEEDNTFTVKRVEIALKYGDVKTRRVFLKPIFITKIIYRLPPEALVKIFG